MKGAMDVCLPRAQQVCVCGSTVLEMHCDPKSWDVAPSRARLSRLLWGLDWNQHLPFEATRDGITVHITSLEAAMPFIAEHYPALFAEPVDHTRFVDEDFTPAKRRYYALAGDFFEFRDRNQTIALLLGTPVDWSTYYLRSGAVLPAYQGRNLFHRFFPLLFACLREAGVERVESETAPSNFSSMYVLTRARFNITGSLMSERWGALIRFTKFLNERGEDTFLQQFCRGAWYQQRSRSHADPIALGEPAADFSA